MYPELTAVSPIDGRYSDITEPLSDYFSEWGLIRTRMYVEIAYLLALSDELRDRMPEITRERSATMGSIIDDFKQRDAYAVKMIETQDDEKRKRKRTRHDVKAVEVWLGDIFHEQGLDDLIPWLHFARTSMDTDNLAYAFMMRGAIAEVLCPALEKIQQYAAVPMLARTHGQPATPTTLGKEIMVWQTRLSREMSKLVRFELQVKCNGATGNWNADCSAFPAVDWIGFSQKFIECLSRTETHTRRFSIRFISNPVTTQIEPHDTYAELFGIFMRINTILLDMCQDLWRYISDDWLVQKVAEGQVGSSTMPYKVNPINFENAEGNLGIANALMEFFCRKLPISRLQRDLSDSTVMRNFGVAFGHCLIAYHNVVSGLGKISANETKIREALDAHPEVIAEAYQTILRREGIDDAYEALRAFTQGRVVSLELLQGLVSRLPISDAVKAELCSITPSNYIGLAAKLAQNG